MFCFWKFWFWKFWFWMFLARTSDPPEAVTIAKFSTASPQVSLLVPENPPKNRPEILQKRGLGGSWGLLGVVLESFWLPGRKKVATLGSLTAFWSHKGLPLDTHFRHFSWFVGVFRGCFFEALFWRRLGSIFHWFCVVFGICFGCFFDVFLERPSLRRMSFRYIIYSVWSTSRFVTKEEKV